MSGPVTVRRVSVGAVGVEPGEIRINAPGYTYTQVTTAGFLTPNIIGADTLKPNDLVTVGYSTNGNTLGQFTVSISAGVVTLLPLQVSDITLPTIAGHIATYTNTTGGLGEDAATAINGGNIQAGVSGTAGTFASFPATASKGSLKLVGVANTGNTNTTISNAAMGQASVISIPDPGAATANFLIAPAAFTAITADASANADATTIAVPMSSNGAGALSFANTLGRYATGSFTLAQVLAAFTTPLEIIPAPGAGFMTVVDYFVMELIYGSAAYSGGGAAYLQYGATAHGTNYATSVTGIPATVFTGIAATTAVYAPGQINSTAGLVTSTASNAAITYTNATANFTVGTGGSAKWYVYYSIVPIT